MPVIRQIPNPRIAFYGFQVWEYPLFKEIEQWCKKAITKHNLRRDAYYLRSNWYKNSGYGGVYFDREEDAVLFKLRWM